jgi:hypothetical protein
MTDLDNRRPRRPDARAGDLPQSPGPKPVTLSAVVGAGACLLAGLVACSAVAVIGWLAATVGGASGAVRAGALAWLAAHKASVTVPGGHFSVAPLGLTLLVVICLYRGGRYAARISEADLTGDLVKASVVLAITYGAGAALTAVLASDDRFRVSPLGAFAAAGSVALIAGTVGVLVESGAGEDILDATPDWLRDAVPAGLAAAAALLASGGALVAVSLVLHLGTATDLVESLDPGPVGVVVLFVLCAVMVPNAVVYGVAFLAGPGFQLGTGTVVAPTGVELGNLPALPLLAALPEDGATPTYLLVLTAVVPLLAGVVGGLVLARRARQAAYRNETVGWQGLTGRGLLSGLVAGLVLLVAMVMASGAAGPGRMADVGVADLLTAALTPAAGVALGAVATALPAIRRRPI